MSGCNIENAAYSLAICAERTAVAKAISEGKKKIVAVAVSTNVTKHFASPCGACRQFLAEVIYQLFIATCTNTLYAQFGLDMHVYMAKPDLTWSKSTVRELLPGAFTVDALFDV